jgi:hypothetical protein
MFVLAERLQARVKRGHARGKAFRVEVAGLEGLVVAVEGALGVADIRRNCLALILEGGGARESRRRARAAQASKRSVSMC